MKIDPDCTSGQASRLTDKTVMLRPSAVVCDNPGKTGLLRVNPAGTGVGDGVGAGVFVGVGVLVGASVAIGVGVLVGESVATGVGVLVGASVAVGVSVLVGVSVAVGMAADAGVMGGLAVADGEGVSVGNDCSVTEVARGTNVASPTRGPLSCASSVDNPVSAHAAIIRRATINAPSLIQL